MELKGICLKVAPFLMLQQICRTFGRDSWKYWPKYNWHFYGRPLPVNSSRVSLIRIGRAPGLGCFDRAMSLMTAKTCG